MSTKQETPKIPLPKGWKQHVRSAVLHVISLAQYATVYTRSWAADATNTRVQLKAELDRANQENALLWEEMGIKDARTASIDPHRRPHYPPVERMAILQLRDACGWSLEQTAGAFHVTAPTISSWNRRLEEEGPDALVQLREPVNRFPDFVRYVVQRLKTLCPAMGKRMLAQTLTRAGLHLGTTTVGRILKEKPVSPPPTTKPAESTERVVTPKRPDHVWHIDLTVVPAGAGMWCAWLPFALPQRWPFCWWVLVAVDHFSRRAIGIGIFATRPDCRAVCTRLGQTIRLVGATPKYIVCDRDSVFDCDAFRRWVKRKGIRKPRYGGSLVWRFRAAPEERHVCVMGQVESAWPVHGSVLVRDGKVHCAAGRSSHLDGGIYVYALDPRSGEIEHETLLRSEEPDVSRYGGRPFDMEGANSDILVAGAEDIYLFQNRFNSDLTLQPMPRITKLGDRLGEPHLMTNDGFLDKTWFNRTYWTYTERWPGYYFTYRGPKSGQILAFDDTTTYAVKVYTERRGHSPEFRPGTGYRLIADRNTTKPVLDVMETGAEKGRGFSRTELPIWSQKMPIRMHGMLLSRERLYLAGPPDALPEKGAYEAMIGKGGALFRVVSTSDGSKLAEFEMDEVPVFDGLIAAGDRLYMSTMDGTLICLGEKR